MNKFEILAVAVELMRSDLRIGKIKIEELVRGVEYDMPGCLRTDDSYRASVISTHEPILNIFPIDSSKDKSRVDILIAQTDKNPRKHIEKCFQYLKGTGKLEYVCLNKKSEKAAYLRPESFNLNSSLKGRKEYRISRP